MLDDRSYMKSSPLERRPVTVMLIIALVVVYVIQLCLPLFFKGFSVIDFFGLSLDGVKQWRVWQLLTFQFLHEAPMPFHLLFNCLAIFWFGRNVEEAIGRNSFLALYFSSGIIGGLDRKSVV